MTIKDVKAALAKQRKPSVIKRTDYLSTGCTLANLALTGKVFGGISKGKYLFCVGDSASGKTFLVLQLLAEAANNPEFVDHQLIYDNVEDGALMDLNEYFGSKLANRIQSPKTIKGVGESSVTIEDFYNNLDDAMAKGPVVYILDSMDALDSDVELKKRKKTRRAKESGEKSAGSYGMDKSKYNSTHLRGAVSNLKRNGSILIIISQTRDNVDPFSFEKKTRAGGKALRFYAHAEMWMALKGKIRKTIKGKQRSVGVRTEIKIKKNRYTGRDRSVEIPIYYSHGFDDTGSCVEYLISEGHWKAKDGSVNAPEFDFEGKVERLIRKIENEELMQDLQDLVLTVWNEIEAATAVPRKKKYS